MNFFPNLSPYVDDVHTTQGISKKFDSSDRHVPNLPYVGYYPNKDDAKKRPHFPKKSDHIQNILNVCGKRSSQWKCKYTALQIGSGNDLSTAADIKSNLKSTFGDLMDISFLDNIPDDEFLCQLPNILIMMGYKFRTEDKVSPADYDLYTKGNDGSVSSYTVTGNKYPLLKLKIQKGNNDPSNNQTLFNACQTIMSQTRMYDVNTLSDHEQIGLLYFFTNKKLKTLKPLFIGILAITIYLLVQGTLSSFDLAFNISSVISSRSVPTKSFLLGAILGILIPMIITIFVANRQIDRTNNKYANYDISNVAYGTKVGSGSKENDKGMMTGLILGTYFCIMIIYYIIQRKDMSSMSKIFISFILLLLLTTILFLTYYWIPILSFGSDNPDDAAFGILPKLRVWLTGLDQKDISQVTSNKYIGYYLQRFFSIFAIVILIVTGLYISRPMKPALGFVSSIIEGIMASCSILALPILWVINWMIGMKYFVGYPMILLIVRFLRYPLYYIFRSMYLGNPILQSQNPKLRAEFDKPQNYTAPWDLLGLTLFKFLIKMNGNKALYSEMFVDPANGYKDISSNSYVTGHFFRMGMKRTSGYSKYIHHGMTVIISFIIFMFILFGVIGKKNLS